MLKYGKIINEDTGLCMIGLTGNVEFFKSVGMTQLDVEQSDIDQQWYLSDKCPMKEHNEKIIEEKTRIGKLNLTPREVFLAIYRDKGITPEQLEASITDIEAKIEFKYATSYYRGNPLVNEIGKKLGYTEEQLDYLFEHKEFM